MGACIVFFILGMIILYYFQHQLNQEYIEEREKMIVEQKFID